MLEQVAPITAAKKNLDREVTKMIQMIHHSPIMTTEQMDKEDLDIDEHIALLKARERFDLQLQLIMQLAIYQGLEEGKLLIMDALSHK